jgi:hypothetical protein
MCRGTVYDRPLAGVVELPNRCVRQTAKGISVLCSWLLRFDAKGSLLSYSSKRNSSAAYVRSLALLVLVPASCVINWGPFFLSPRATRFVYSITAPYTKPFESVGECFPSKAIRLRIFRSFPDSAKCPAISSCRVLASTYP